MHSGTEWLIDASQCDASMLRDGARLRALCDRLVDELHLHVVGRPQWHQFPWPGGWTGLYLLSESHLACHTFPEDEFATFNLYCCRERPDWPWTDRLLESLDARRVTVRRLARGRLDPSSPPVAERSAS